VLILVIEVAVGCSSRRWRPAPRRRGRCISRLQPMLLGCGPIVTRMRVRVGARRGGGTGCLSGAGERELFGGEGRRRRVTLRVFKPIHGTRRIFKTSLTLLSSEA
jgi:hypothetical protein